MRTALGFCVVSALLTAVPVAAQTPRQAPGSTRDFLFGEPRASVSVRGTWIFARAGSDLFDFVTNQLTLERRDFSAPALNAEVGVAIGPQLEVLGGVEWSNTHSTSEYRRFVDNNNLPIAQDTTLKNLHLGASVKYSLWPRGRTVSRLAWVPRGVTPYVGGGAGAVRYEFFQSGDFVDFVDNSVFTDAFGSKGWAPSGHVFGGVDLQVFRLMFLQVEGRYLWASAKLDRDFVDFDPIDLAGFRTTAGVSFLF